MTRIGFEPVADTTKRPRSSTARNWEPSGAQTGASGTGDANALWPTRNVPSVLARAMRNPARSVPSVNAIVSLVAGATVLAPAARVIGEPNEGARGAARIQSERDLERSAPTPERSGTAEECGLGAVGGCMLEGRVRRGDPLLEHDRLHLEDASDTPVGGPRVPHFEPDCLRGGPARGEMNRQRRVPVRIRTVEEVLPAVRVRLAERAGDRSGIATEDDLPVDGSGRQVQTLVRRRGPGGGGCEDGRRTGGDHGPGFLAVDRIDAEGPAVAIEGNEFRGPLGAGRLDRVGVVTQACRYHPAAREVEVDFADAVRCQPGNTCERLAVHPVDGEDVARGEEAARPGMQDAIVEYRCGTQREQFVRADKQHPAAEPDAMWARVGGAFDPCEVERRRHRSHPNHRQPDSIRVVRVGLDAAREHHLA